MEARIGPFLHHQTTQDLPPDKYEVEKQRKGINKQKMEARFGPFLYHQGYPNREMKTDDKRRPGECMEGPAIKPDEKIEASAKQK